MCGIGCAKSIHDILWDCTCSACHFGQVECLSESAPAQRTRHGGSQCTPTCYEAIVVGLCAVLLHSRPLFSAVLATSATGRGSQLKSPQIRDSYGTLYSPTAGLAGPGPFQTLLDLDLFPVAPAEATQMLSPFKNASYRQRVVLADDVY